MDKNEAADIVLALAPGGTAKDRKAKRKLLIDGDGQLLRAICLVEVRKDETSAELQEAIKVLSQ